MWVVVAEPSFSQCSAIPRDRGENTTLLFGSSVGRGSVQRYKRDKEIVINGLREANQRKVVKRSKYHLTNG